MKRKMVSALVGLSVIFTGMSFLTGCNPVAETAQGTTQAAQDMAGGATEATGKVVHHHHGSKYHHVDGQEMNAGPHEHKHPYKKSMRKKNVSSQDVIHNQSSMTQDTSQTNTGSDTFSTTQDGNQATKKKMPLTQDSY